MDPLTIDFDKHPQGLVPAIIQHYATKKVLMLGYMNRDAFDKTTKENRITFYSRSKKRLWTKGETSNHFLEVKKIHTDCDADTLLILAKPNGPTCHLGSESCFEKIDSSDGFLFNLEKVIEQRLQQDDPRSYTVQLSKKGIEKVAQKVGEEAVELVIESIRGHRDQVINEAADLMYHTLLLLKNKRVSLREVEAVLKKRHTEKK